MWLLHNQLLIDVKGSFLKSFRLLSNTIHHVVTNAFKRDKKCCRIIFFSLARLRQMSSTWHRNHKHEIGYKNWSLLLMSQFFHYLPHHHSIANICSEKWNFFQRRLLHVHILTDDLSVTTEIKWRDVSEKVLQNWKLCREEGGREMCVKIRASNNNNLSMTQNSEEKEGGKN